MKIFKKINIPLLSILFFIISCEDRNDNEIGLYINEFLASNNSIYADEIGEYDDWVELYNSTSDPIDISGMYFADDLEDNLNIIPSSDQFSIFR